MSETAPTEMIYLTCGFQRFWPCCFLMCIEEAYYKIDDGKAKLVYLMTGKGGAGPGRDGLHSPSKDIP